MFPCIKAKQMFVSGNVAKLIREDLGVADEVADSAMGMTKDPIVDIRVLDILREVGYKCTIDATAGKLIRHHQRRRHMMREDNLGLGLAGCYGFFDKRHTTFMFPIEVSRRQTFVIIQDAMEIGHIVLGVISIS